MLMLISSKAIISIRNCMTIYRNESGSTPLHFAAGNGHRAIVEHLLQTHRINTV